jgi:Ca2+-transporting ATPase
VRAVELGRGLYDNLRNYVRFQMGALIGFIATFLGASILNIASGVPFVPLQTLYVNFTTQISQAVGLGFGKPADDIMQRKPRAIDEPILPRAMLTWLACAGVFMGAATLGVLAWATNTYDAGLGRAMALATFSFANVAFSFTVRDERKSIFRRETLEDSRFLMASGISVAFIVLANETRFLQRVLQTVNLDFNQWVICLLSGASIVVVSEVYKAVLRARRPTTAPAPAVTVAAVAG